MRKRERELRACLRCEVCDRVNVKSKVMFNLLPTEFPGCFSSLTRRS